MKVKKISGIQEKIKKRFVWFAFGALSVVLLVIVFVMGKMLLAKNIRNEKQICQLFTKNIDVTIAPTNNLINEVAVGSKLQNLIIEYSNLSQYEKAERLSALFSGVETTQIRYWNSISFYMDGELWHRLRNTVELIDDEYIEYSLDETIREKQYIPSRKSVFKGNKYSLEKSGEVISILIPVYSLKKVFKRAVLIIEIPTEYFFENVETMEADGIYVLDKKGKLIYKHSNANDKLDERWLMEQINGIETKGKNVFSNKQGYYFVEKSEQTDWLVVMYKTKRNLLSSVIYGVILMGALIMVLIWGLLVLLLRYIISDVVEPIRMMSETMSQIVESKNTQMEIHLQNNLEFQNLSKIFNKMLASIKQQNEDILQETKMRQKVEYDMLVSRMNPHFIYNCLNNIKMLMQLKRYEQAKLITENLVAILVYDIRLGEKDLMSSVEREIALVKRYIEIELVRYPNAFDVEWDVENEVFLHPIPKLILQPIVENAVVHGIIPSKKHGTVYVSIEHWDGQISICIANNGVPFDEEMRQRLNHNKELPVSEYSTRIGLSNIRDRMHYIYKGKDSFYINVTDDRTGIYLRMPDKV